MKYYAIYSTVHVDNAQNAKVLRDAFPMDKVVNVTKTYDDAVKIARDGRPADKKQQYAIYEITINGRKGTHVASIELKNETIDILQLTPNDAKDFKLVSASLAHVNKKFKAVDLTAKAKAAKPSVSSEEESSSAEEEVEASASAEEASKEASEEASKEASEEASKEASEEASKEASEEASKEASEEASADSKASKSANEEKSSAKKDEDKKTEENKAEDVKKADEKKDEDTNANSSYVTAASAVAGVGIVATGFWFSGLYPSAVALLAKAGLTIPAAAVAAQVGVSVAVGIAVVGVLALGYYGFSKLFGSSETSVTDKAKEEPAANRTEDQKYHDELKAKQDLTSKLAEHFTSKTDKKFLVDFDKALDLEHTAERKFKKDGDLMKKQPAATDKLVAFGFKAKMLAKIDALTGKDRTAKEKEVLAEANARVKAKTLHRAV